MADGYNTLNYRAIGGSTWVVGGDLNVVSGGSIDVESGGVVSFESGAYAGSAVATHTTNLSPLIPGAMNLIGGTTVIKVVLPSPVAGMRVQVINQDQTTSVFNIESASTSLGADITIGSSTEVGTYVDSNTILLSSGGCIHELMAMNSTNWFVLSNRGASACTTSPGTSA